LLVDGLGLGLEVVALGEGVELLLEPLGLADADVDEPRLGAATTLPPCPCFGELQADRDTMLTAAASRAMALGHLMRVIGSPNC
jgi:hypothetical protein